MSTCILVDGPFPDVNHDGDEIPTWSVFAADDELEPAGTVYRFFSYVKAVELAKKMAKDRRVELVLEAMPY